MGTMDNASLPIRTLINGSFQPKVAALDMLRIDVLHPVVSGNKWFKLKYNLEEALQNKCTSILTFGGGYSNHLVAAAFAAQQANLASIGIIRGIYATATPTLLECEAYGMKLVYVPISEYKNKQDIHWLSTKVDSLEHTYIVPEGGANSLGRKGAALIGQYIAPEYSHIAVSVGSGTTLAGIHSVVQPHQQLLGFVPMKGGKGLINEINPWLSSPSPANIHLIDDYHFGGFGKYNQPLIEYMNQFYVEHNVPLDIIYTSKMMWGMEQLLQQGYFPNHSRILCIHTGGLQGNRSIAGLLPELVDIQ